MKEKIGTSALRKKYKLVGAPLKAGVRNYPTEVYDMLMKSDKRSEEDKAELDEFKGKNAITKAMMNKLRRWLKEEGYSLHYDIEKEQYFLKRR